MITLNAWLATARASLLRSGREDAEALADWWAVHVLGVDRTALRVRGEAPIDPSRQAELEAGLARLHAGEPLQYLTGSTDFFGRVFHCSPQALIPRPETEELTARALRELRRRSPGATVLDVGTGSGCIAITVALERPDARVQAVDLSPEALELARANARSLNAAVDFRLGDLLAPCGEQEFDLILSNPPYVSAEEMGRLDRVVHDHEPHLALVAGPDGLSVFRRLLPQARARLRPGGSLLAEHGDTQGEALRTLAREAGFVEVRTETDLAGRERFLYGRSHGR